ncbi:MAG: carboxypeptidase regulatory-like domain-containing protein [Armatimonadota bacterium]
MFSAQNSRWKSNSSLLILLLFTLQSILPLAGRAQGKGQGLEVRAISPTLREVMPGHILSLTFQVALTTDGEELLLETLTLPDGWQPVIPPTPFTLAAGERTARILAVQVPTGTPAGRYTIEYTARSQRDYALQDRVVITVDVLPVRKLTLVIEDKPETVVAGRTYQVRLRLTNQGNTPLQVDLRAESSDLGYREQVDPAAATLAAGQSLPIVVTGTTPGKEKRSFTHYVQVIAQPRDAGQPPVGMTYGVEVLPLGTSVLSLDHTLPTQMNLRLTSDGTHSRLQTIWHGAGSLDAAGDRQISFLIQGPDQQESGVFGLRDEMRLNYLTEQANVRLGDQSYGLSYLTDHFHYGRGLGADFRLGGGYAIGAYTLSERWQTPNERVSGAYLSQTTELGTVKLNYLQRAEGSNEDHVWSVEGLCPLLKRTETRPYDAKLAVEVGRSRSTLPGVADDDAYRLNLDGRYGRDIGYAFQWIHAGPDYRGYYRDTDYLNGTLTFPILGRLRGNVHYSAWQQNLECNPDRNTAPDERLAQVEFLYPLPSGWAATLGYDDFRRRDLLQPAAFSTRERPLRFSLSRSQGPFSWTAGYRQGTVEDLLVGSRRQVREIQMITAYQPAPTQSITLYGGYRTDGRNSFLLGPSTHLGSSVSWQPMNALSLSAWFNGYNLDASSLRSYQGQLSARYRLEGDRAWELQVLALHSANGNNSQSYMLSYSLPIDLKVGRKKNIGQIQGQVYDPGQPGNPGVAEVILRVNNVAAVTDNHGRFTFPALPPGNYTLMVDQRSIGLNRITLQTMPMQVSVTGGQVTRVNIGLTPEATLTGQVLVKPAITQSGSDAQQPAIIGDPTKRNAAKGEYGLANVLLELSNGTEILRRLSDHNGAFTFDRLQPGRWHLKIYGGNLPAYHRLEAAEMDFELTAEETAVATVNVLPLARPIKLLPASTEPLRVEVSSLN